MEFGGGRPGAAARASTAPGIPGALEELRTRVRAVEPELVALRRDIHRHPEIGRAEIRTTRVVRERLEAAGLAPYLLPTGTGLWCDIGDGDRAVALRADIDALPVTDLKDVPYRSLTPGLAHACGHDVHTAAVVGAGLALAALQEAGRLPGRVRLVFQPAEERLPGGSLDVIDAGGLKDVDEIFALHCDPRIEVGRVGVRPGPITGACDRLKVVLRGPGGHTARPHLTADLVHALGKVVTELPGALSRRVDPRAGLSLVWGRIDAGSAPNAIPQYGEVEGTLRCLDTDTWREVQDLVHELVQAVATPYGVSAEVVYSRGVPPVDNEEACAEVLAAAAVAAEGEGSVVPTPQSLGGEDFAWYLEHVPGALARLGTATPGDLIQRDLHQGAFDVDERAIGVGARVLAATALLALARTTGADEV
ncbi:amidohydrolase [Motilibacter deserti]|uniref:Amidohydrolase n=1 Tax=Motilibacter deserti TaxID=2714956 RepID=A0ABX0GVA6_9ACTN|nr:amidohydrolase [Motilibacter deserti]NHC14722.1 amidohydrolase [Motilibacter deserti]